MQIQLHQLKLAPAFSQETTAYTATILVDGQRAFHAHNSGHGAADSFNPIKGYDGPDLAAIDTWLAAHEPPDGPLEPDPAKRAPYDCGHACDLELLVARLIDRRQAERQLSRLLKASILRIGDDEQIYKLKMRPSDAGIAAVRQTHPAWAIVNAGPPEITERAVRILSGAHELEEAVYARQRENRLTLEDARWLLARNSRASQPCPDLHRHLTEVVTQQGAILEQYRAQRAAARIAPSR
ncbi:hypothetical protein [Novosphingobium sp. HII-3]|uniref:hypothetical protein n=1 Tax=Novosphingobium sp. HII-3 TaxID=2075565 RepID=UPI000CDB8C0C|nr:hypothetical protein [Novosphingobium sp. HII-3]